MRMAALKAVHVERLICLLVIGYLQLDIYFIAAKFSQQAAAKLTLPGLRKGHELLNERLVDLSDAQWRDFRGALPLLTAALSGFVILSQAVRIIMPRFRPTFYAVVGLGFLGALHGACTLYILTLALINYALSNWLGGQRFGLGLSWTFNCTALVLVRVYEGMPFSMLSPSLVFLDQHRGMLRWHIHYNLLVLRMLSFAADYHWALTRRSDQQRPLSKLTVSPVMEGVVRDPKARITLSLPAQQYNFVTYLAYLLYPPLYVAGPIATFNSFASQLATPVSINIFQVLKYAARWLFAWLLLEALTHTVYCNSLAKYRQWDELRRRGVTVEPLHVAVTGYWVLLFMWLKFLVIWRLFRLFAMADGIDVPENMGRCVCNNYDIEGFWRSWHASYNQWLVRYLYIPLGGAQWRIINVWIIFTFVALWHDLEWHLLGWAWIMALAMAPETVVKRIGQFPAMRRHEGSWLHRHICAACAAINITILMIGNLVGFVVGVNGIVPFLTEVTARPRFLLSVLATFFAAAHLMFGIRDWQGAGDRQRHSAGNLVTAGKTGDMPLQAGGSMADSIFGTNSKAHAI